MGDVPLNPSRLANGQGFRPPPPPNPSRRLGPTPPNPSRLANGQGFRPPPPPQPFTTCKWTRVAGPPTLHHLGAASKWTRVGGPPQPFTTCKWTRVAGPATLHDLGAASKWTRVGADFPLDKGWGPPQPRFANGQGVPTQPCTTCRWTRVGGPNPSRLANLKFCLDKHWSLQTIERLSIFLRGPGAFHR